MKSAHKLFNNSLGFTLVELLIVIAIIGILAGVVTLNVINGTPLARDGRRISEINSIESTLEQYFSENKEYPAGASCNGSYCKEDSNSDPAFLQTELVDSGYLKDIPQDPINDTTYNYEYGNDDVSGVADTSDYYLHARLEDKDNGENIFKKCDGNGSTLGYYYMKFSSYTYSDSVTGFSTCPSNCTGGSVCYRKTW